MKSQVETQPNQNFYLHVNEKWLGDPNNKIPDDYSSWGGFTKLRDESLLNQISLIKELNNNPTKSIDGNKIISIWNASIENFTNWTDYSIIMNEFNKLDLMFYNDTISAIANYSYYAKMNGIENVLNFDKDSDLKNSNNVVLQFSCGGLSLPSRDYYMEEKFEEKMKLFKQHLINIQKMLNLHDDFVSDIINFENKLAKFTMKEDQERKFNEYYCNTTLTDLYTNINELTSLSEKEENYSENDRNFKLNNEQIEFVKILMEKLYGLFDFRNILTKNYNKNFANDFDKPNEFHITTFDGDNIRRVFAMLSDNIKEYKSFLQYKIISTLSSFCSKELDDEFFDFYQRKINGQTQKKSIEKRTIGIVNKYAGEMMGKLYVEKYFSQESKDKLCNMIKNILFEMKCSIENSDWLTDGTKVKALIKLSKFVYKIGYPDKWKDYSKFVVTTDDTLYSIFKKYKKWSLQINFFDKLNTKVDKTEWFMTPQTVNAYFDPSQNEIVFPAAILQAPFFHQYVSTIDFDVSDCSNLSEKDIITATNFGGIGAIIAHEITHGYDDQGCKFDENGNLVDWWTDEDHALYKERMSLLTEQVSQYKFIDVEDNNKEYTMSSGLTMGENLADLGGISLGLKSMKRYFNDYQLKNESERLALMRVFFKSWANGWKQNIKKDRIIMLITMDPHAPTDFRANLVKNNDSFYDVFDVNDGNMYLPPNKRVQMW